MSETEEMQGAGWELLKNAAFAAKVFAKSFEKVERLRNRRKPDPDKLGRAVAQFALHAYALHEALELTEGEWDDGDIGPARAIADGRVDMNTVIKNSRKKEQKERFLKDAILLNEDGDEAGVVPGASYTVLKAWRDEKGQPYAMIGRSRDEEGEEGAGS